MKKLILLLFVFQQINAQSYIAMPRYSANSIEFYTSTTATTPANTLNVGNAGTGVNGVVFYGSDMFVAGGSSGIKWYAGVSFNPYNLASITPTALSTGSGTIQVVVDASGNVYVANVDGTITKFIRSTNYATKVTARFSWDWVGGLGIDNTTNTIWAVLFNNSIAVCKLSDFSEFTSNIAPFVKQILDSGTTPSTRIFWLPEGIAKSPSGDIWVANNNDTWRGTPNTSTTLVKIKSATVTTIVNALNATSNADYTLNSSDYVSYPAPANSMLGGITYDEIYSNKMYVNNQRNSYTSYQYSFDPTLSSPTFTTTAYTQGYPGNGQAAIIPCALLPTATASSTTISSGQTANLSATNCAAGAAYQWKDGATIVGTSASTFTTPVLNASKTYTVACNNGGTCIGATTSITVTVTSSCTPPAPPTLTVEAITPSRISAISYFNKLIASSCAGTVTWNTGSTASSINVGAAANPSSTYTATCKVGTCVSNAASIVLNYITPPTISATPTTLCAGQNATFTATGCTGGTIKWYRQYSNTTFLIIGGSITTYSYTDIGTGTTLLHAPNDYGLLFQHYSYYATCVINSVNSGFSNAQTFTHTPVVNISPTVSNSGPITTVQPLSLTAANLAPGGGVCSFDYSGQYITVTQDIPSDNFTIEMWFKTNQSNVGLFSAGSTPITNLASDRHIYIDASGILRFRAEPVTGASFSSNVVVNDNIWHHVAVTHSSTGTSSKIYVDGKLAASRIATYPCFAEQVFRIGVAQENTTTFYTGQIDNIRIWNVVRTFDEIRQTANLETPATTTNLIYHVKMDGTPNPSIGMGGSTTGVFFGTFGIYPNYLIAAYYTYTWTGQNAPIGSTSTTQTTTGAADGTYTLNVTPTIGCSVITATTTVTAVDNFVVNSNSGIPIVNCGQFNFIFLRSGESSTLTATGCSGTISWVINSISTTGISLIVNAPTSEEYLEVVCTQANGYVNTIIFIVDISLYDENLTTPLNTPLVLYSNSEGSFTPIDVVNNIFYTLHGIVEYHTYYVEYYDEYGNIYNYSNHEIRTYTPSFGFEGVDLYMKEGPCSSANIVTITVGNPNPCPALLTLQSTADDIPTGTVIKQASSTNGTIEATNAVTGTANVIYQAKSIELNAGFKADNGTVFTAEVGGCL